MNHVLVLDAIDHSSLIKTKDPLVKELGAWDATSWLGMRAGKERHSQLFTHTNNL